MMKQQFVQEFKTFDLFFFFLSLFPSILQYTLSEARDDRLRSTKVDVSLYLPLLDVAVVHHPFPIYKINYKCLS